MVGRAPPSHLDRARTDEILVAAYRVGLALTLAVSAMRAATEAAAGTLQPLVYLPAVAVLAGWIALRQRPILRSTAGAIAGYAAALVWITLIPAARSEAVLVPLFMALLLVAAAGGLRWLWRWLTEDEERSAGDEPRAWIEDDNSRSIR
jgi:hypothetical protein